MALSLNHIKKYIENDMNIVITGLAGTGKTMVLSQACEELGLNMKYYETSTLDPFSDLVGIPVPQHDTKTIEYYRPKEIDGAEVVFFDEINRADIRTLNALLEIIQFKTINGERLPKLRCVVAAMNPDNGDYTVDELDVALLDRFDVFLTAEPTIDYNYFKNKFSAPIARAVSEWWGSYYEQYTRAEKTMSNKMGYISPRRMEKVVSAYLKIPGSSTIKNVLPPGAVVNHNALLTALKAAVESENLLSAPRNSAGNKYDELFTMGEADLRSTKTIPLLQDAFARDNLTTDDKNRLLTNLALAFNRNIGADRMTKNWGFVINEMSPTNLRQMMTGWPSQKRAEFAELMGA